MIVLHWRAGGFPKFLDQLIVERRVVAVDNRVKAILLLHFPQFKTIPSRKVKPEILGDQDNGYFPVAHPGFRAVT
jgi:hypothetical protein